MSDEYSEVVLDQYDELLRIGTKVAFNYCGKVCLGEVVAIKRAKRYGKTIGYGWGNSGKQQPFYNFHIRHCYRDVVSIVKNRNCVIRIK